MKIVDKITKRIEDALYKKTCYGIICFLSGNKYDYMYEKYKGVRKAFLLMEPEYGNLGDHAIAYASEKFIKDNFSEYELIPVNEYDTCRHGNAIKKVCTNDDLIFIQGGGNMGSLYPYIERLRRFCIKKFSGQKVISMPTSIYYSNNWKADFEYKKSIKVYSECKNLFLLARDKNSYDFMCKNYPGAKAMLVPDIVYYLYNSIYVSIPRNEDALICLRAESESEIGESGRADLINEISRALCDKIFIYDTTVWRKISRETRELELKSLFRQFSKAKYVVTDRMHGMIFSAVTRTPCVAIKSLDGKVKGSFEWIDGVNYIKMLTRPTAVSVLDELSELEKITYFDDIESVKDGFKQIRKFVLGEKNAE